MGSNKMELLFIADLVYWRSYYLMSTANYSQGLQELWADILSSFDILFILFRWLSNIIVCVTRLVRKVFLDP